MDLAQHTICLCMIVKNEASVIRRCLDSVIPVIDSWVIVDTGSTDGTQDIIRSHMSSIPGLLHQSEWRDFAYNRSESLRLARHHADYSLIIDADDVLEISSNLSAQALTSDCYEFNIIDPPLEYPRIHLVSNKLEWCYRGVLHEFIDCTQEYRIDRLPWSIKRNHDGARRKNPTAFAKDIEVFLRALETETDPYLKIRYTFYLAQSYRDNHLLAEAMQFYAQRAAMGGWIQEVYYSLYQIGALKEKLGMAVNDVLTAYEAASQALPARVEALHGASRLCRINGRYIEGYEIAKRGLGIPYNSESLFGEPWIYEYGLLDEYAVNAYWAGFYQECLQACLDIVATEKTRGQELLRIVQNARYALIKLREGLTS
jgi:glycosyltransferase involved in cell wall biosynthesis